ncbi:MAG: hypothetical protein H6568_00445 [Lewinellaceae bacterium]|nr:hypothetical protein [Saprospiraceae bacterium]MCB9311207.1 hypothetical protein [Lewinellaceae bacterium]HRW74753.1 hypothetical protein [Saprospiraceae bacterium]
MIRNLIVLCLLAFSLPLAAQHQLGVEIQVYPTGLISSLNYACLWTKGNSFEARIGYNLVDHRDLGVQDDEKGGGFGASLGYAHPVWKGLRLGVRTDIWWNEIDWKMAPGTPLEVTGTTQVTVLQPTATLDYPIRKGNWQFTPRIAFGAEINVRTDGEEVGQGAILLVGIGFSRFF